VLCDINVTLWLFETVKCSGSGCTNLYTCSLVPLYIQLRAKADWVIRAKAEWV